jgi:putative inorganic carbon (HCO3(-)) transporter
MADTDFHAKLKPAAVASQSSVGLLPSGVGALLALAFGLTSLVAVWAAYDRDAAWVRFVAVVLGLGAALVVGWIGRRGGEWALGWAGIACAMLAAAVGTYFLLTYEWSKMVPGKPDFVYQVGMWVQGHRPSLPSGEDINANVAGGALVILLPLGIAGLGWAITRAGRTLAVLLSAVLVLLLGIAGVALLLTASRGAWIALGAGGAAALFVAWRQRRPARAWLGPLLLLGGAILLGGIFWAAVTLPGFARVLGNAASVGNSVGGRPDLWRGMLALVGDYPFTGSGLGSTMMVYSTYVLLLHVGYITHAHNLFLQIAVEQGLPGLILFLALLGVSLWGLLTPADAREPKGRSIVFAPLAAAAIVALVVHGMVDAGLYVSRLGPVVFLPVGFGLAAGGFRSGPIRRGTIPLALVATAFLVLALLPAVRAALQANLAAVAQTRAELSRYEWPSWPIQDALRRSADVDLGPAVVRYRAALSLDPNNVTANRRLGQIELSQGQYDAARAHLEAAFKAAPGQRATRQLLGELYAIGGDIPRAAGLWRTIDLSLNQLDLRVWWYNHLAERDRAALITAAARAAEIAKTEDQGGAPVAP